MTNDEKKLFLKLAKDRKDDANVLKKPAYRGIWTSVIDKYPDSAHFVYELLQNGDDAGATKIYFKLTSDGVLFKHNGYVRFSISDIKMEEDDRNKGTLGHINSITSIGASTKNSTELDDSQNKIGKFGVGFKAVFQYTQTPHIYDDVFCFKLTDYVVPVLLDCDHPERKKGETLFFFPFDKIGTTAKNSYAEIELKLKNLDNPILFLRNLKEIKWENTENNSKGFYTKRTIDKQSFENAKGELLELKNSDGKVKNIWLFTQNVIISEKLYPISVGYFLNEKNRIDTKIRPKIFCFFPTKEDLGFCFVMHAPFQLVDNRQQIKRDDELNESLIEILADLAAESLVYLRDIGLKRKVFLIDDSLLNIVPLSSKLWFDEFSEKYFYHSFLKKIQTEKLLLSREKKYLSYHEALWADTSQLTKLLNYKQINDLVICYAIEENTDDYYDVKNHHFDFVFLSVSDKNFQERKYITDALNIKCFDREYFAELFTKDFIKNQEIEWIILFYRYLIDNKGLWDRVQINFRDSSNAILRTKPIIKLQNGDFASPYTEDDRLNVFLPSENLTDNINVVHETLFNNEIAKKFFNDLGVKKPDHEAHIRMNILSKYAEDCEFDDEEIISDFRQVYLYFTTCQNNLIDDYIQLVNKKLMILGKADNNESYLYSISDVYKNTDLLHEYFRGNEETIYFADDFYTPVFNEFGKAKVMQFINLLALKEYPEIEMGDFYNRRSEFINACNQTKDYCDYKLCGLENFLKNKLDKNRSIILWEILENIKPQFFKASIKYKESYARQFKEDYCDSAFVHDLKQCAWLYDCDGQLKKPSDVDKQSLSDIYKRNQALFDIFEIKESINNHFEQAYDLLSEKEQNVIDLARTLAKNNITIDEVEYILNERIRNQKLQDKNIEKKNVEQNKNQKELNKCSLDELFEGEVDKRKANTTQKNESQTDIIAKIKKQQCQELETQSRIEELKKSLEFVPKYTTLWFRTLLELEYSQSGEVSFGRKSITISFNKVEREADHGRIYVLKNPSRFIPTSLEEIGGLEVKFIFKNIDELSLTFEVANVREYTLRLKAKISDEETLEKIDFSNLSHAIVNVNNPIQLIDKLKTAFNNLNLEENINLKENLPNSMQFVFGPPGTGKTTFLAKKICDLIEQNEQCKILVLAPTNKACDVLTYKVMDLVKDIDDSWLWRFVATGDERIENEEFVYDRDSNVDRVKKLCLISTIARFPYDGFRTSDCNINLKDIDWDYIIIDEASMIPIAQIVYAIYQQPKAQFLIAGDPFQIQPIVHEPLWEKESIYTMVELNSFANPLTQPHQFEVVNLDTQYRSVPALGEIFSKYQYENKLKHNRNQKDQRPLKINGLDIKTINFVPFRVERYDSIFGAKKLSSSNIHIYSVLLVFEFTHYISKQIAFNHYSEKYRIGIICPYAAEAQLIDKLLEQKSEVFDNIEVVVGTIHGFQGDECDIIITVFNPPVGLKGAPDKVFLNNQNIINVAVSRARDYLFVMMPHKETEGFDNLYEIKRLGKIASLNQKFVSYLSTHDIENAIFSDRFYIENNTFVTSHQLANVYSKNTQRYEVRIDDNAVDVQINFDEDK